MEFKLEIFNWKEQKPKHGSLIYEVGYNWKPSLQEDVFLGGKQVPAVRYKNVWVRNNTDSAHSDPGHPRLRRYVIGQEPPEGYTLRALLGDLLVEEDYSFAWMYAEDITELEVRIANLVAQGWKDRNPGKDFVLTGYNAILAMALVG